MSNCQILGHLILTVVVIPRLNDITLELFALLYDIYFRFLFLYKLELNLRLRLMPRKASLNFKFLYVTLLDRNINHFCIAEHVRMDFYIDILFNLMDQKLKYKCIIIK